jgi:hypothetical protein
VVNWAAMEFLLQAMRKNRRRLKFEQWLLLATRCALLVLLGLALARPLGCANNTLASLAGQRNGLHVFVIDNSYSMAYDAERPGAKTHLDQAKLIAGRMIDQLLRGGEAVVIITGSHPATAVIAKPSYSVEACRAALDSIEQSNTGTDLAAALTRATQVARDENRQPTKFLYVITDGTRSAFEGAKGEGLKAAARDAAAAFGDAEHLHLFDLGKPDQWNQALLDLKPLGNLVTTKFSADFTALPRGYGMGADPMLRWQLDEKDLSGGGAVHLSEGSPAVLLTNQALRTGGPHVVTASLLSTDRLPLDNARHRVVNVASEMKVLIVDGERSTQGLSGSGAFLELALAPMRAGPNAAGAKSDSPMVPRVIGDQDLGDKEVLGQYRAILLANVARVPENVASQLEPYVEQGGVVMLFMGPKVDGSEYNRTLLTDKIHLLPGKLIERISASSLGKDSFLFDFKPEGNLPVYLSVFRGEQNSGLSTARVFQYWRLSPTDSTTERVLNYLPAGQNAASPVAAGTAGAGTQPAEDPAITVHTVGRGRVVFFSTTANADWTSFPAKPAYVSLLHELLDATIDPGDGWMNLTVGDRMEVPPSISLSAIPTLSDPNKVDLPVFTTNAEGQQPVYQSKPLLKPGVYHLTTGNASYPIAVNVPADEADIRTLPEAAIRKALADVPVTMHADALPADTALQINRGRDLGWSFMFAFLLLAAFECFVAMHFGHHRRLAPAAAPAVAK